jgi:hypothetical protein
MVRVGVVGILGAVLVLVSGLPGVDQERAVAETAGDAGTSTCGAAPPPVFVGAPRLPALAPTPTVRPGTVLSIPKEGDMARVDDPWAQWGVQQVYVVRDGAYEPAFQGTYEVTESDIGATLQVVAIVWWDRGCYSLTRPAYSPVVVVDAAPLAVAAPTPGRATSTVAVEAVAKPVEGKTVRVRVHVTVKDNDAPQGMVTVIWGSKRSESVSVALRASHKGNVSVKLPALKEKNYTMRATFIDTTGTALDATSGRVKLKIARRK